ncbi:MAG: FIST N-terminal domain-containing protein [Planctomycetota bacterium]|nr:FIST N-terminal domain-containing protein [Planctomycetota bacterium]
MDLQRIAYSRKNGWSDDGLPALDSEHTLVVTFGSSCYLDAPEAVSELSAAYPNATIVGCSTAGEIVGDTIADESLSVAILKFDHTRLRSTSAPVTSPQESFQAGERIARELADEGLAGILVLSDGLNVNGSELVRGLNSVLPEDVVVTGGLAGDGDRFERTWVLDDGRPVSGVVTAVGFYGDRVRIGHGSMGGWDLFGPERTVTRAEGNVLFELDGEPALALYKKYLGERAAELPASALLFPLSLRIGTDDDKSVVRTILSVSEEDQSMTFAGDLPEGGRVQLMRANFDRLIEGAAEAALHTKQTNGINGNGHAHNGDAAYLSIAISCVGRRIVLGERTEEELEAALEVLPQGTQQVGFYSYGEISPYATGHCDLHNQTMTLTTITEE